MAKPVMSYTEVSSKLLFCIRVRKAPLKKLHGSRTSQSEIGIILPICEGSKKKNPKATSVL